MADRISIATASSAVGEEFSVLSPFRLAEVCKAIPGGRWEAGLKRWVYPATPTHALRLSRAFANAALDTDSRFSDLLSEAAKIDAAMPYEQRMLTEPVHCRTKPWRHQLIGYNMILDRPATMLAFDMGTGKSKTTVDAVVNLGCRLVLIVCPKAVCEVWPHEFDKHGALPLRVISLHEGTMVQRAKWIRSEIHEATRRSRSLVLVLNYDVVYREPIAAALMSAQWDMVVCDESHRIKRPHGKASRFMWKLGTRAKKRVCLTGTPMPHSPEDVWAQFRFLDSSIFGKSFVQFRREYSVLGGFQNHELLGFRNTDALHKAFYSLAIRVQKRDVLDLPPVTHEVRKVDLSRPARQAYGQLMADFVADVAGGVITAANALARLLRLQQVTSGFGLVALPPCSDPPLTDNCRLVEIDTAKYAALIDILNDLPPSEHAVVFCRFKHDLEAVAQACRHTDPMRQCFELSGDRNQLDAWRECGGVLATQIQAGREGIDFTKAAYCVYYSLGFSLGDYDQSLARTDRHGQTRPVTYYHLIARGTVDEQVYEALTNRRNVIEFILAKTNREVIHGY